jgi:uncharacterized protein (TIGR03086 family)
MPVPLLDLLDDSLSHIGGVLSVIRADQRGEPTPCPDLTVGHLVAHVINGLAWYGQLPAGGNPDPREVSGPDLSSVAIMDAFDTVLATTRRNWTAEHLDRTFALPFGDITGEGITAYTVVELLAHGWDLAMATGQPVKVPGELAEAGLAIAHGMSEELLRAPGMMAAAVPVDADAPAIDRLVAFLGRRPIGVTLGG